MQRKTFKFRLFTNANQERELAIMLETHRRLYNAALEAKSHIWDVYGVNWSYFEQSAWMTKQRKSNPHLARLNSWSAQNTLRTLDKAFKSFFLRIKRGQKPGYPRFQNTDRFNSFGFDMSCNGGGCKIVNGKLRIQNVGTVRVRWHRAVPEDAKVKQAQIVRENDKWFVCFFVEVPCTAQCGTGAVGVDVGLSKFVTTSDGESMGDSRTLESNLSEFRRRQRAMSRCRRGSNRRTKVKKRVTTLHAKVRNARKDMHHKVARSLVDRYEVIAVEGLNVHGMIRNSRLARRISDAGWAQFVGIVTHKAESAGGHVVAVDPRNTSRMCSQCGHTEKDNRQSQASFVCRNCGHAENADVNAAKNILARAEPEDVNVGVA